MNIPLLLVISLVFAHVQGQNLLPIKTPSNLVHDTIPYFALEKGYSSGLVTYTCNASAVWSLKARSGNFYSDQARTELIGTVYLQPNGSALAGKPTWKITLDGSIFVGESVDSAPSPDGTTNEEWVWTKAYSYLNTNGSITQILYILSFSTIGGVPDPSLCNAGQKNTMIQVTFNCTYYFYGILPSPQTVYTQTTITPQNADFDLANNQFNCVNGWYKDNYIPYYKFLIYTEKPFPLMPIYFLTYTPNDYSAIVPGQLPIISDWQYFPNGIQNYLYSDFVTVVWVTVPTGYVSNLYKSYPDLIGAGLQFTPTNISVNMPFVPMGSTLQDPTKIGTAPLIPLYCWYAGAKVQAFTFETTDQAFSTYLSPITRIGSASTPGLGWEMAVTPFVIYEGVPTPVVTYIPLYFLNPNERGVTTENHGGPFPGGMRNILDIDRHDANYSPLWQLFWAAQLPLNYTANMASDAAQLQASSGFVIEPQPIYVNCPTVGPYGGTTPNPDKSTYYSNVVGEHSTFIIEGALVLVAGINITATFNNTILGSTLSTGIGGYQITVDAKQLPRGLININTWRGDTGAMVGTFLVNVGNVSVPAPPSSGYLYSVPLFDGLVLSWTPLGSLVNISVTGPINGWIALGFTGTDPESMIGSTAVVGWDQSTSDNQISAYYLGGKVVNLVTVSTTFELKESKVETVNGVTTINFLTNIDGHFIKTTGPTYVIASYKIMSGMLEQHDAHIPSSMAVNFLTGDSSTTVSVADSLTVAHTILMPVAWLIILPFGVLFARYAKSYENTLWFKVHQPVQIIGFILSCTGIICIIVALNLPNSPATVFTVHHVNGFIIFSLSILQIIIVIFRPHPTPPDQVKPIGRVCFEVVHHWNGRFMIVLAVANVFLGIALRGYMYATQYQIILGVLLAILALVLTLVEIKHEFQTSVEDSHVLIKM